MKTKYAKTPFLAAFSVGAVLFSAHAGGGFATGNQANTYYVGLGWAGVASAIVAMLLLTLTMREAMIMYNSRGLTSHKQLFETLYYIGEQQKAAGGSEQLKVPVRCIMDEFAVRP